jgi:hypothetical protein
MITLPEARAALLRSGYLLESRVEALLRRRPYYVNANQVFPDPITRKARELDVYAMKATRAGPRNDDWLFTVLLLECVNNPEPLVLITKVPQATFLHREEVKVSGLPVKFPGQHGRWVALPEYLAAERFHHYCRGRVATQYCSFQQKKQAPHDWMAWHDETHFDAFRKLGAALEHAVTDHYRWRFANVEAVNIQVYYPIVVVQGRLMEARPRGAGVEILPRRRIALRLGDYVGGKERTYQIDVVQEGHLARYLNIVEDEVDRMAASLRRRSAAVRAAVDRIARQARRLRSPEAQRAAMEAS